MRIIFVLFLLLPFIGMAQNDTTEIPVRALNPDDITENWQTDPSQIISASRSYKNIEDLPFTAYVITAEQIRDRNYTTLVDLMKDLPGIKVSQPGSAANGETFLQRGQFGNQYVKILIDNIPIQPSGTNGMPIGAQLPLQQAERVEIIYGPAAAIYGGDAMAGIINIVTKSSRGLKTQYATAEYGSRGYTNINFTIGNRFTVNEKIFDILFYGGYTSREDWGVTKGYDSIYNPSIYANNPINPYDYVNRPLYRGDTNLPQINNLMHRSGYSGIRIRSKNWTLGAELMRREEHAAIGLNPLFSLYHNPNSTFGEFIQRYFVSGNYNWDKWTSQTNLSYLRYNQLESNSYITLQNPFFLEGEFYNFAASDDIFLEQLFSYEIFEGLQATAGGNFQYSGNFPQFNFLFDPFDKKDYTPFSEEFPEEISVLRELSITPNNFVNTGLLAQLYLEKGKWEAVIGARYDFNRTSFISLGDTTFTFKPKDISAFNPRFGISYKFLPQHTIKISGGTGFKPPSSTNIYQRFVAIDTDIFDPVPFPTANQTLEPETHQSLEVAYRFDQPKSRGYFSLSGFIYKTSNLITKNGFVSIEPYGTQFEYGYLNDKDTYQQVYGIEANWVWVSPNSKLKPTSEFSATYYKGEENLPYERGQLSNIRMTPNWMVKWYAEVSPFSNFFAYARSQFFSGWVGRSTVLQPEIIETNIFFEDVYNNNAYFTLDLGFRYKFGRNFSVHFDVMNVLNAHYGGIGATGGLGPMAGRINPSEPATFRIIAEDLILNPQQNRWVKFGLSWDLE